MSIRERLDNRAQLSKIRYFLRKSCRRSNSFFFSPGLKQKRTFQSHHLCRVTADIPMRPNRAKRSRVMSGRMSKTRIVDRRPLVRHVQPTPSSKERSTHLESGKAAHHIRK